MKRINFYLEQVVAKEDLALLQDNIESMFAALIEDLGIRYAYNGLYADANNPNAMAVRVHPGRCYFGFDGCGQHGVLSTIQLVALNLDKNGAATAVQTNGNERWLSVWVIPKTVSDTPVITPAGITIQYRTYDSVDFAVTMGAEAAIGSASRPALESVTNGILIADVRLTYGMTTVPNANIDASRVLSYGQSGHERGALPYLLNTLDNTVSRLNAAEQNIVAIQSELDDFESTIATNLQNLQTAITALQDGKSDKGHHHLISEVTGLSAALDGIEQEIAGKAPSNHNHDSRYHLKTGDEVHDGHFQVTQAPISPADVVRLADISGLQEAEVFLGPGSTWDSGYALVGPLTFAWVRGPNTYMSGANNPINYLTLPVTFSSVLSFSCSTENTESEGNAWDNDGWYQLLSVSGNSVHVVCQNTGGNWSGYARAHVQVWGLSAAHSVTVTNADIVAIASNGQVFPKLITIQLTSTGGLGTTTWTIEGGTATASFVNGYTDRVQVSFPALGTYTLTVKATDSTGAYAVKTINVTLNAYQQVPLVITTGDQSRVAAAYPFNVNIYPAYTGGDAPITWSVVAGSNTTLPNPTVTQTANGPKIVGTVDDEGSWTIEIRATDSGTPTPQVVNKILNVDVTTYVEPPDPYCFEAGSTYVLMADGAGKLMKDIRAGDIVLTVSERAHQRGGRGLRPSMVMDVTLVPAVGGEPDSVIIQGIKSTEGHAWGFVPVSSVNGDWVRAKDMAADTQLVQAKDGHCTIVPAGDTKRSKPVQLAGNLGTDAHTYFVGSTANGPWFLVHNIYYPSY